MNADSYSRIAHRCFEPHYQLRPSGQVGPLNVKTLQEGGQEQGLAILNTVTSLSQKTGLFRDHGYYIKGIRICAGKISLKIMFALAKHEPLKCSTLPFHARF